MNDAFATSHTETPLPGMVRLKQGHVVRFSGIHYVVVAIGMDACNAKVLPLTDRLIEGTIFTATN